MPEPAVTVVNPGTSTTPAPAAGSPAAGTPGQIIVTSEGGGDGKGSGNYTPEQIAEFVESHKFLTDIQSDKELARVFLNRIAGVDAGDGAEGDEGEDDGADDGHGRTEDERGGGYLTADERAMLEKVKPEQRQMFRALLMELAPTLEELVDKRVGRNVSPLNEQIGVLFENEQKKSHAILRIPEVEELVTSMIESAGGLRKLSVDKALARLEKLGISDRALADRSREHALHKLDRTAPANSGGPGSAGLDTSGRTIRKGSSFSEYLRATAESFGVKL